MATAEEKFNSNALYAMEHIMELVLYTPKSRPIEYKIDFLEDNRKLSVKREVQILEKLQEFRAIEIVRDNEVPNSVMPEARVIYLVIRQPKFDDYYQELKKPFRKKEEYQQKSTDSLKKIVGVLNHLKEEWDLTPEEAMITEDAYWDWISKCGLSSFPQLQGILTALQQEGLILDFEVINEAR